MRQTSSRSPAPSQLGARLLPNGVIRGVQIHTTDQEIWNGRVTRNSNCDSGNNGVRDTEVNMDEVNKNSAEYLAGYIDGIEFAYQILRSTLPTQE